MKKLIALLLVLCLSVSVFAGCGAKTESAPAATEAANNASSESNAPAAKKTFVFGDTTFNAENDEANVNPHQGYAGWACIRYGVGETLFKINDAMGLDPWVAESYEMIDELTWKITLKDGVCFSNGNVCDAAALKACFEHLIEVHDRARGNLNIESMDADGLVLTIHNSTPVPALMNYLAEPYACVIDISAGITEDGIVVGTGPFVAVELETDSHVNLVKNEKYWDGDVKIDEVYVRTISDGDTLALALQSGEIDAAYGMAYASYPLFENNDYVFTGTQTSRAFFCAMNFASPVIQDPAVRKAVAMGIDKEGFVNALLNGYGYVATGAFPDTVAFGGATLQTETYDPEGAKAVLETAGWVDTDGDGYREKDGQKLIIRWLSYPSRQELPLLAESAQATLKEIGIQVELNVTADHNSIAKDPSVWDIHASANVNCGLGDPTNFFATHCLDASTKNRGGYHNDKLEALSAELNGTFDQEERNRIAIEMQQVLLDDNAFIFCSFLRMSMISKASVTGLKASTSDFYEMTANLDIAQ